MASNNACTCKLIRDESILVNVEFVDEKRDEKVGEPFKNEGYIEPFVISPEKGVSILNLKCSGNLCVNKTDPLNRCNFVANPKDASDKLTMYQLEIPNQPRDKPQPKIILLESRVESLKHHFLHWSWPGPSVTFQEFPRYDSNTGIPQVDILNKTHQRFMWMIPVDQGNQFSLKPYDESCYLVCVPSTDKAALRPDGKEDHDEIDTYRVKYD